MTMIRKLAVSYLTMDAAGTPILKSMYPETVSIEWNMLTCETLSQNVAAIVYDRMEDAMKGFLVEGLNEKINITIWISNLPGDQIIECSKLFDISKDSFDGSFETELFDMVDEYLCTPLMPADA